MRYRDLVGYNRGEQTSHKLQLITFLGWTINSKRWDTQLPPVTATEIERMGPKDKLTLWYTMYGQTTPLPNPFPTKKRNIQFNDVLDLSMLEPRKHYAVWCVNIQDIDGVDKSGYWFWTDILRLTPGQANEVLKFKKTRRDIDAAFPKEEIICVSEMGFPHGNQFYKELTERYGPEPKGYEYKLAYKQYMETNGLKRTTKALETFDKKVKKEDKKAKEEEHINDLLTF